MSHMIAIDAGTTGVRSLLVDENAQVIDVAYRELTQHFPSPGWVEHDPAEIWAHVVGTLDELMDRARSAGTMPDAIGITNQRETVIAWDRHDGRILAPGIVWQDKRTSARCDVLKAQGALELVRSRTGLVLDPYFSGTKMEWLIDQGALGGAVHPALGTVDSWIVWNLTGSTADAAFVTDPTNASRTLLYDLDAGAYDAALLELFGIPADLLAEIRPSCGRFGVVRHASLGSLNGVPISGILGDQQAALFGQACFAEGMVKATYGTGAFVLLNTGTTRPPIPTGLLTTVAWDLGAHGARSFALEGSAFVAGAAIQWLRDELGIIESAAEVEALALSAPDSGGVSFVPAFVGLGSPWWDDSARGAVVGITRGSTRAVLARSVIESLAYEVRAITDAMAEATGAPLRALRADGGAAAMDLLLRTQADQSKVAVERPASLESTALGAATIAGLAEGIFSSLDDLSTQWSAAERFSPRADPALADLAFHTWCDAVERARAWV